MLDGLLDDIRYISGTFDDDDVYAPLERTLAELDQKSPARPLNRVFYLSTAPEFFPVIAAKLGEAGLEHIDDGGHADRGREAVRL